MGYTNIKIFHAGAPAWQKDGNPLITSYGFVAKRLENVVLIDYRDKEASKYGYIQGAFAIPLKNIRKEVDQFPLDTKVPIIFYGQDTNLSQIAPEIKELSYSVDHKMFVLNGGYNGWTKQGGPTQSGKVRSKIVYLPKPGPGEIVGDEFMNIVKSEPEDKVILDVRTVDESTEGKIEWAKNIPLDDLQARMGELPKDKEIIIHCGTGMRAQMANSVLKNAGYKSRFLNDKLAFIEKRPICCFKE